MTTLPGRSFDPKLKLRVLSSAGPSLDGLAIAALQEGPPQLCGS